MIMYQISTLQALALGYTRPVITVKELLDQGDIGLGTFEDVNGEMIVVDGVCYRAAADGSILEADPDMGVPFAAVTREGYAPGFEIEDSVDIQDLKDILTLKIEEVFGLNSMHIARVDGQFDKICARSEAAFHSQHIELKEILSETQHEFFFEKIEGTLVCIYFPDYMDGINAPGWHLHFLSADHMKGGHVFDLVLVRGHVNMTKINRIEIQLPKEAAFDTYSLKEASGSDIRTVEQGKGNE